MVADWLFAPTDNINLIVEVMFGILVTAWVAGWWSRRKLTRFLLSAESDPLVDRIIGKIPKLPKFPEFPEFPKIPTAEDVVRAMPDYPDLTDKLALLEVKLTASLTSAVDAKMAGVTEQLSTRVGQVVQANIASAKSAFARGQAGMEEALNENDGSMLTEVLGIFMDEDTVQKVGKAKKMYSRFQAQGGFNSLRPKDPNAAAAGGGPPQYPYGTVLNGHVATLQGWVPIARAEPPPARLAAPPPPVREAPVEAPPELPPEPKAPGK